MGCGSWRIWSASVRLARRGSRGHGAAPVPGVTGVARWRESIGEPRSGKPGAQATGPAAAGRRYRDAEKKTTGEDGVREPADFVASSSGWRAEEAEGTELRPSLG